MTKRWLVVLGSLGLVCAGSAASPPAAGPRELQVTAPPLLVLLSVDQMRAEYVTRFDHEFSGGFRRLLDEGIRFTDVRHDHAFTATAPGHATLVTGVHPARHGVVSNDWWDRVTKQRVYAVEDPGAKIVGFDALPGRSPRNLLVGTIGDWLKDASPRSQVVSLAIKDRVAVTMGGRQADAVYWYEYASGRYITSSFYDDGYPDWLTHFNDSGPVHDFVNTNWERLYPEDRYDESREDDFAPEGETAGPTFPHAIAGSEDSGLSAYAELTSTPFGDIVTFALAQEAIKAMKLGEDAVPDLLAIGASSADLVGHRYGPFSQEIQDYYFRLDRALGEFLDFMDDQVGVGRWQLVLSSDHGVATMPEESLRRGIDARRLATVDFQDELIMGLQQGIEAAQIFAQPRPMLIHPFGLITAFSGDEVTEEQGRVFRAAVADGLRESAVVKTVLTFEQLLKGDPVGDPEEYRLFRNSFHPERAADVVIHHPANYVYPGSIPATHGTPYDYDTDVPLMVLGRGAKRVDRAIRTVDIAPTLAMMLGITPPDGLDGTALEELRH